MSGKKSNNRKKASDNTDLVLCLEVGGVCPLCTAVLIYTKKNKKYKGYEIAHIYPLNPTLEELALLKAVEKLSEDPNHEKNLIPLCLKCHGKFDKPRTVEEYNQLAALKKKFSVKVSTKELWAESKIQEEVRDIVKRLSEQNFASDATELSFLPLTIDQKTDDTLEPLTKKKIKFNVTDYFTVTQRELSNLDKLSPHTSSLISIQIKQHYTALMNAGQSQQEIFDNLTDWVHAKTGHLSKEACGVFISFFIQNCEVFSDNSQ